MSLTNDQITANNFKDFYDRLRPYLGIKPAAGFTPIGTVITVMGDEAPEGYLICNGFTYDIKDYPELADFFEEKFGSKNYFGGDGTSTFKVPNMVPSKELSVYCIAVKNLVTEIEPSNRNIPTVTALTPRWLRFDPDNKKGLVIKAGTSIKLASDQVLSFERDRHIDLSSFISDPGKDYFVFVSDAGIFSAALTKASAPGICIGRFHTLCANAGSMTMIAPASPSSGIVAGDSYLVKPYKAEIDPDFYAFYNKIVTLVSAGTPYDVITCNHPLSGFLAGDILPESVFCLTWYPDCLYEDAMVYDKTTNICVDVYLQSGTGFNTRSAYNQTHTVNRQQINHSVDYTTVGKRLLFDNEFTSIARGSNEQTNIQGASDLGNVGGHVDSSGRRMISAIGCEDCCGYIWQFLCEYIGWTDESWEVRDGRGSFGKSLGISYVNIAGGYLADGDRCGSNCRYTSNTQSTIADGITGRGCTSISTGDGNEPIQTPVLLSPNDYSFQERVVGTWVDGKPLYQKTFDCGAAPDSTKTFQTGLGVNVIPRNIWGYAINSANNMIPLNAVDPRNNSWTIRASASKNTSVNDLVIPIITGSTYGSEGYSIICTLQYTKTSD